MISMPDSINTDISISDMLTIILQSKKQKAQQAELEQQKSNDINQLKYIEHSNGSNHKNHMIHTNHTNHTTQLINNKYDSLIDIDIDIKCRDCNSRHIIELNGYYVCQSCSLINDCIIDSGQEWRFFGSDDNKTTDPARCDMTSNDLLPKTSIGALVGFGTKENKTSKLLRNMSYWNSISYSDSTLITAFNNITVLSQNAGISQCIIEEAKYMYKKVTDVKSSRRTKKEAMKAGSVILACKAKGVPRNYNEIATIFKLKNNKTFRKSIKTFEEIWNNIQLLENGITQEIKNNNRLNNKNTHINKKTHINKSNYNSNSDVSSNDSSSDSNDSSSDSENVDLEYNQPNQHIELNTIPHLEIDNTINTAPILYTYPDTYQNKTIIDKNIIDIQTSDMKIIKIDNIATTKMTYKTLQNLQKYITKLHRFACILGFNDKVFEACRIILTHVESEKYLDKHTPLSRTSTVIYYVVDKYKINVNKYQILQTCEVSEVTINKCYQELLKFNNEIIKLQISI